MIIWPAYFFRFFPSCSSYWSEQVLPHFKIAAGGSHRHSKICWLNKPSPTFRRNNRLPPPLPLFQSVCVLLDSTFSHRDTQSAHRKRFISCFSFFALFPLLLTQPPFGEQRISATVFYFHSSKKMFNLRNLLAWLSSPIEESSIPWTTPYFSQLLSLVCQLKRNNIDKFNNAKFKVASVE